MTKFETLYEMADKIMDKLDELYCLTVDSVLDNDPIEKSKIIEDAKILIIKEYDFVQNMALEDIDICLTELREIIHQNFKVTKEDDLTTLEGMEIYLKDLVDTLEVSDEEECKYDADILLRAFDRLKSRTYILWDEGIKLTLTREGKRVMSYEISVWDAVMSILNIQVAKTIRNKISSLQPQSESDEKFIKDLKYNFRCFQMKALFANFASEMQALYAENDLDRIVICSIEKLKQINALDQDTFNTLIIGEAEFLVEDLSLIETLEYKPGIVFDFLKTVTSFENLIPYMDSDTLKQIHEYSKSLTTDENSPCMSGINTFVKRRIKKKEQ